MQKIIRLRTVHHNALYDINGSVKEVIRES